MNKIAIVSFFIFFSISNLHAKFITKHDNPKWYYGLEIGSTIVDGGTKNDYDSTYSSELSKNISYESGKKLNFHAGINKYKLDFKMPVFFLIEGNISYIPESGYEIDPYLKVNRESFLLYSLFKMSWKYFSLGLGLGAIYNDRSLEKSSNSNYSSTTHLNGKSYTSSVIIGVLDFKYPVSERYTLYFSGKSYYWNVDHGKVISIDTSAGSPYYLDYYRLPESHTISSLNVGIDINI